MGEVSSCASSYQLIGEQHPWKPNACICDEPKSLREKFRQSKDISAANSKEK